MSHDILSYFSKITVFEFQVLHLFKSYCRQVGFVIQVVTLFPDLKCLLVKKNGSDGYVYFTVLVYFDFCFSVDCSRVNFSSLQIWGMVKCYRKVSFTDWLKMFHFGYL